MKLITENKQAYHEYFVDETYIAGICLEGAEVKSVRNGSVNLKDSFCGVYNGEVFVRNMHIAVYDHSGVFNSRDSKRERKLLLNRYEINKIVGKINEKGYTLVPLKLFFKDSLIKVELGLCKGKHTFDKKKTLKEKDLKRQAEREIKNI